MEWLLYIATGFLGGLLSGMFGVGGGIIVVPILALLFAGLHFPPDHLMHLAIGTSLATIIVNSIVSSQVHHRHGNVNWTIFRRMAPTGILGAILATWLASRIHNDGLQLLFAVFECVIALHLFWGRLPEKHRAFAWKPGLYIFGGVVGTLSSLLGIGGGTVSVPFLIYGTRDLRMAIGTAAAIGLPLAIVGTLGYIVSGLSVKGLPPLSLGFVYLPAVLGISLAGIVSAPLGVKLAQRLPTALLKKILAILLFMLGLKMGWNLL
jgi:uncharacterized membrane protein YfcA